MATVGGGDGAQQPQPQQRLRRLQDGTGTFGGRDGAPSIPQTTASATTTTTTTTATAGSSSGAPFDSAGKDVAILLLSFLAVVLLALLLIRWLYPSGLCPRNAGGEEPVASSNNNNTGGQFLQQQQQDEELELSRMAKLSKLKRKERRLVLEKLFESTTFNFKEQDDDGDDKKTENESPNTDGTTSNESQTAADDTASSRKGKLDCHCNKDENTGNEPVDRVLGEDVETGAVQDLPATNDEDKNQHNDHDSKLCCSICLTEYETGDSVMTGRQCNHMFHADCFLLWAVKRDHCPYCRKELFTAPHEFRTAALRVLGEGRVREIEGLEETEQEQTLASETATAADAVLQPGDSRAEDNSTFEAGLENVVVEANSGNDDDG